MDLIKARDSLIFALDVHTKHEALEWASTLAGTVRWLKVGSRLFCSCGPAIVDDLRRSGFRVFLDLKFHDIPAQVRGSCHEAGRLGASMMTIHCSGGPAMMAAAAEGAAEGAVAAGESPALVMGVTVLTSLDADTLHQLGVAREPRQQADLLADLAHESGLGGIVCSPHELGSIRQRHASPFRLLSPGIRPKGASTDDQARVATASMAIGAGADYLVVGRPIRRADDPVAAADALLHEMAAPDAG